MASHWEAFLCPGWTVCRAEAGAEADDVQDGRYVFFYEFLSASILFSSGG